MNHNVSQTTLATLLCCMLLAGGLPRRASAADDTPQFSTDNVTGDWGGTRTSLFNKDVCFDVYYKLDIWSTFSGGAQQGQRVSDNLDVKMTVGRK